MTEVLTLPGNGSMPRIVVHAGAGADPSYNSEEMAACRRTLRESAEAGGRVLSVGGAALDAVIEAVKVMEDFPLFNAGRGAALTTEGEAELDAAVMAGSGQAGGVTCSRSIRNPVIGARAVMEHTPHLLLVDPPVSLLGEWGVETAPQEYFITQRRLKSAQRAKIRIGDQIHEGHGTVGAVAVDVRGEVAAATSTGGFSKGKMPGRVGDTPIIGAGTFAKNGVVAVSGTGHGEDYIRSVVAHDVAARIMYGEDSLEKAVLGALDSPWTVSGGIIAVNPAGDISIAYNTAHMWRAYNADGAVTVQG